MKIFSAIAVFAVICASAVALAADIAWGPPTNGLQAGITVIGDPSHSNMYVQVYIRNAGTNNISVLRLASKARFQELCSALTISVEGQTLPYNGVVLEPGPPPTDADYISLAPGDTDTAIIECNPANWELPDAYSVHVAYTFADHLGLGHSCWTGEIQSKQIQITKESQQAGAECLLRSK